jgi:6-phosphogluconolactonase
MARRTILVVGSLGSNEVGGGIHLYDLDQDASAATWLSTASDNSAPSFIAIDADASRLYAVDETRAGTLAAYALNPTSGRLTPIGRQSTLGDQPCHVALDRSRRFALVSNFGIESCSPPSAQSMAVIPTDENCGLSPAVASVAHERPGAVSPHQDGPHAHCAIASLDNRYLMVTNYGGDQIFSYPFDPSSGALGPPASVCKAPDGSGPRTIVLARDGAAAFVSCELSSSLATLSLDRGTGQLYIRATAATLPQGATRTNYPAELRLSRDGRYLYVSNRGHDSITTFAIEDGRAQLTAVHPSGGIWPRCLALSDDGKHLAAANQKSGEIVTFAVDSSTGALSKPTTILRLAAPVFVDFGDFVV